MLIELNCVKEMSMPAILFHNQQNTNKDYHHHQEESLLHCHHWPADLWAKSSLDYLLSCIGLLSALQLQKLHCVRGFHSLP